MLGNELLDLGKWKNFMFDQWLAICCDIIEMAATIHFSKITQMFATLKHVDLHFRQRIKQIRNELVAILVYILTDGQSY